MKVAGIVLVVGLGGGFLGAWLQSRLMRRTTAAPAPLAAQTPVPTPQPTPSPVATGTPGVTEVAVQPGDSLKKLAQQHNVPEQAIMDVNPTVQRWETIRAGPEDFCARCSISGTPSPAGTATAGAAPGTVEVIVGPGDSISRFAQRYGTTPARIRELNPHITNWAAIRSGQKVFCRPLPVANSWSLTRRVAEQLLQAGVGREIAGGPTCGK